MKLGRIKYVFKFVVVFLFVALFAFSNVVSFLPQVLQNNKFAESLKVNEAHAAVSLRAVGAYVSGTANLTPVIPATAAAGDMMLLAYGTKPYSDAPTIDQGWISIGSATDGTVAAGIDVGSMQARIYYKIHTGSEVNPTITNATNNVSGAVIIAFQKGASEVWETPVGAGGGDATAGTGFSVTASSNPGITAGDMLVGYAAIRSDAGAQSAITVTATGATVGSFTESPASDLITTAGGDMAMSGGYVAVTAGTASAAPVYNSTLAAAHTGSAFIVRLRAIPNATPTLTVIQPDGTGDTVTVGDLYNITYDLADTDNVVTAAMYYDADATGLNGIAITGACATAAEGAGATCSWDTTGMTPGTYYVYGITNDGVNPAVSDYSPGVITINAPVVVPDATSFTNDTESGLNNLGGRTGQTITLTGTNFDAATSPNRANCAGGAGTGCVQIGGYTIPDGNFTVWNSTTITFSIPSGITSYGTTATVTVASQSDTTPLSFKVYPNITAISPSGTGEAKEGDTITITGTRFGATQGTNKVLIDGVAATISSWADTSIDAVVPSAINDANNSVTVRAYQGTEGDNTIYDDSANFVILPKITGTVDVPTGTPDAAREYSASDSDGVFTVLGNHFGAAGTVTILGGSATQQTTATCAGSAYQATCVGLRVPDVVGYTGNIIITRTADTKTNTYAGFRVLPRIISTTPVNLKGGRGDTIAIAGDHLCQSGVCPSAFSATDKVSFNGGDVTLGASAWTDTSIPSVVIPGTAIDGNLNITSDTSYASNNLTFDVKFAPTVSDTGRAPANAATDQSKNLIETGSVFTDGADGDTQSDSEWQVDEEGTFVTPEWTDTVSSVTSVTINTTDGAFAGNRAGQTDLACGTTYSWRFRYKDNGGITSQEWSSWSNIWTFTTVPCGPDATSVTYQLNSDGAKSGYSATISGTSFGTVNAGSRANCAGGAGTGCVRFTVGGNATVADANVTAWSANSITFTVNSALASEGGVAALEVTAAGVADTTKLTFYIYPTISGFSVGHPNGDGDYQDQTVTISGDHLGSSGATTNISFNGQNPSSIGVWASTSISTVDIPNAGTDSGTITVTRSSDSKSSNASTTFYIYPQVTGISAATFSDGGYQNGTFTLSGNHFGSGGTGANISVNGAAPSSIGVWGSGSVASVDIPDAGTDSGVITLTNPGTGKTSNNSSAFYIYPQITSFTASQGDGDVQSGTITITGNHFGVGGTGANILINGANPSSVTWTSSSSLTAVDIPNAGTDSGVIVVTNPATTKSSNNSSAFIIYPQITSLTVSTATPDAAREYLASDSDGIITVNGNHFGAAGSVTVLGSAGTQQTTGTCSGSAYQSTCTGIQIPTAIANNSYTGNVILTRTSDTKTNTYAGFRVLPRITSTTPINLKGGRGDTIAIAGDHLCQSGTCPSAFSATDKVSFNGGDVTLGASAWTDTSIPFVVIPGTAIDGNLNITSNTSYISNNLNYNIKFAPSTPTNGSPAGEIDIALNPTLNSSIFSDGTDGDSHLDSEWQIDEEGTFAAPEWSETLSAANISVAVNTTNGSFANNLSGQTSLACGKTYYFKVRYKDNGGVTSQEWSTVSSTSSFDTVSCGPDATSVSNSTEPALTDGGRIGHTIVISGSAFGTVNAGSRANCAGGAGTGCVKIGGTGGQTVADSRVTAWSTTSITIQLNLTDLTTTYGGVTTNGLIVYGAGASDPNGLTFYVYPDITSLTAPLGTNDGAREYDAGDTDGVITIIGNKFGTAPTGGQTVIVGGTVATYIADGTCDAVDGWTETCIKVQVPAIIADNADSGYVVITQGTGSNNKATDANDAQGAINIWPRVTGISAASFADGGFQDGAFTLNGNHFGATAGSITVNGAVQDGTPTWGAASITGVGIPNGGTDSGNIILTKSDTKTSNTFSTFYIYPQITSFIAAQTDGDVQSGTITISGNHFGIGGLASNISINGTAPSSIGVWGAASIATVDIPNSGSDFGVIVVTNPGTSKNSNNSSAFYIYPQITSLTVPTVTPDAAREYSASDSNGIITINGNHFGTDGSITVLGQTATQQTTGTCSGLAYQATCAGLQIPTAIADNSYTGNIVLTRSTGGAKSDTFAGFRVLPRIISNVPDNGVIADVIQVNGNHFCQSGTCPTSPNRSSSSDNVKFGSTQALDSDFMNQTGGAGSCDGSGAAWTDSEICVKVPSGISEGSQPTVIRTNNYDSNTKAFTVNSSTPNDPANLYQFETNADLNEPPADYDPLTETNPAGKVAVGGGINQTNAWLRATAQAGVNATLCIQVEVKPVATAFDGSGTVDGTGPDGCKSFTIGTPVKLFVNATSLLNGTNYKWRARIKNNGTGQYSNWINAPVDGQSKSFYIDTTAPSMSCSAPTAYTASTVDINWSSTDAMSTTFTKQLQYGTDSSFATSTCTPGSTCSTPSSGLGVNPQTIQLTGLAPNTVYYYRERSKDAAGNEAVEGYGLSGNTACTFTTSKANMRTAEFIVTGETGAVSVEAIRNFQVYLTEQGANIQNAFVELSGIAGTGGGSSLTLGLKVEGSSTVSYTDYDVAISNTVATPFTILHKIDTAATGLYIAPASSNNNKLYINPSSGDSVYIASAKIVVTYYYTP